MTSPLVEELQPACPPLEALKAFQFRAHPFLLDGGMDEKRQGRYTFMGSDPFLVIDSYGLNVHLSYESNRLTIQGNPFKVIADKLEEYRLERGIAPVPFLGGAVGYFSYDMGRLLEKLPVLAKDDLQLPECAFAFYDSLLAYDNLLGKAYIVATGFPEKDEAKRLRRARQSLSEIRARLDALPANNVNENVDDSTIELSGAFTHQEYVAAVAKARDYIIAGDIFEVNISQRFEADIKMHPLELFRQLRHINPAPYACYQEFDEVTVVSASPERFLKLEGDRVQTRPIKGTRPRGADEAADKVLAAELLSSTKDRAENMMIVDLERNDLGRVCRFGSVRVDELAVLETFPTVHHLTSTVSGQLRPGYGALELLLSTFPGGSITGAPKIRAMEIIEDLEPTRRSVYTGSIGYWGFNGDIDFNIAIRTMLVKGNRAYFQVGGAVVYDSDPEDEYQETLHKGRALMKALHAVKV